MILSKIVVPLLNANEPEARLVEIHVTNGQLVEKGMALFTIETTKAASEIEAETKGYIRIFAAEGDILEVGGLLAMITENIDDPVDFPQSRRSSSIDKNGSDSAFTGNFRTIITISAINQVYCKS